MLTNINVQKWIKNKPLLILLIKLLFIYRNILYIWQVHRYQENIPWSIIIRIVNFINQTAFYLQKHFIHMKGQSISRKYTLIYYHSHSFSVFVYFNRGLYGRGLSVPCCSFWRLYGRGLFDRIPFQTLCSPSVMRLLNGLMSSRALKVQDYFFFINVTKRLTSCC